MDVEISPEPPPDEARAVEEALEQLESAAAAHDPGASAWWRAGVRENLAAEA